MQGGKEGWQDVVSDSTEDLSGNEEEDETQLGQRQSSLLATGTSQVMIQHKSTQTANQCPFNCCANIGGACHLDIADVSGHLQVLQ